MLQFPAPSSATFNLKDLISNSINTRHLPLFFSYSSSFISSSSTHTEPKLDFSRTSDFYHSVESSLLASTNNSTCSLPHTSSSLVAYTDGSCPNNRTVGPDNPAGWGFSLYVSSSPFTTHQPVIGSSCDHSPGWLQ